MDKATRAVFENYFSVQAAKADALTFGQKLELADLLLSESQEEGKVPVAPDQVVRLPVAHPAVAAVLSGQSVSVTGKEVKTAPRVGLAGLSTPAKLGILAIPVAVAVIVGVVLAGLGASSSAAGHSASPTPTVVTATVTMMVTATLRPVGASTPITPTATPFMFQAGSVAGMGLVEDVNAPASVEFAGYSFGLSVSALRGGVWEPKGPEYLEGAELRRVVAVPYSNELNAAATQLKVGTDIRLRLRSGEMVVYRLTSVKRVRLNEIELLTDKTPSLVIVLYGERSTERTAIIADAIQQPDGSPVVANVTATPAGAAVAALSTTAATGLIPPGAQQSRESTPTLESTRLPAASAADGFMQVITTSVSVVNPRTGMRLTITDCLRVSQIGDQKPSGINQQYLVCGVRLVATTGQTPYSGLSLAISEAGWMQPVSDWWPQAVPIQNGLGDGMVTQGSVVMGKVAGLVRKTGGGILDGGDSVPVLLWEQAGLRFVIQLEGK
jgi:hypothetical protein